MLQDKRILLIIGGGIAAYKSLDLIRRFRERGARVRVVITAAGQQFVTPLAASALSGDKVFTDLFSLTDEAEMGHIELSRDADLVVVAPATANLIARLANGHADDLASTLLIATDKRVLLAPAMNVRMWQHPATQRNVACAVSDGATFVGPDDGEMACGEFGPGRMSEPLAIVAAADRLLADGATQLLLPARDDDAILKGRRIVVTSGPTHEPIDPVRYIANRSSGRQGHAIAEAAARAGGEVVLISGPVNIPDPAATRTVRVETAEEMLSAVEESLPADIFVSAAAVADWRMAKASPQKVKKARDQESLELHLVKNPDILAKIARRKKNRPTVVVGFAAETERVEEFATAKRKAKKCDLIVANNVSAETGIMGGLRNQVHLVDRHGTESWPLLDKQEVARRLIERFARMLQEAAEQ